MHHLQPPTPPGQAPVSSLGEEAMNSGMRVEQAGRAAELVGSIPEAIREEETLR